MLHCHYYVIALTTASSTLSVHYFTTAWQELVLTPSGTNVTFVTLTVAIHSTLVAVLPGILQTALPVT
jgi:ABC-type spermidine/putrescine transport system permease subunit II